MGNQRNARAGQARKGRPKIKRAKVGAGFWRQPSLAELIRTQGIKPVTDLSLLKGKGADLWESDEEFDKFVAGIYERRKHEAR